MRIVLIIGPRRSGKSAMTRDIVYKCGDAAITLPLEDMLADWDPDPAFPHRVIAEVHDVWGALEELRVYRRRVLVIESDDEDIIQWILRNRPLGPDDTLVVEMQFLSRWMRTLARNADEAMVRADLAHPNTLQELTSLGFVHVDGGATTWQRWTRS